MPRKSLLPPAVKPNLKGEMYPRPKPNPGSLNWKDGFSAGYANAFSELDRIDHDKEWRDGYYTGRDEAAYDREQLDRTASSNT